MPQATLDKLRFFTDTPDLSAFQFPEAPPDVGQSVAETPPTSRVVVAKTGTFRHPRYGEFKVSAKTFDAMIANFGAGIPTPELPVDFDHEPDVGGKSEACGWVKSLSHDGAYLYARVEWLWRGAFAIREKTYQYVSPTWALAYVDEDGTKRGPTLLAFGLTNRPYFRLPAVSLSESFARDEGGVCEEVEGDASDRPIVAADMKFSAKTRKRLGLAEDATDEQVFAAIEAQEGDETQTFGGHATLEEAAKAEGKVIFTQAEADAAEAAKTDAQKQAERIEKLEKQSADQSFRSIFDAGVKELKLAPANEEEERVIFDAKGSEAYAEYVKRQTPVVNGTPSGQRGQDADDDSEAPEGVDPEAYALDRKVQIYMREHDDVTYTDALDKVRAQEGATV